MNLRQAAEQALEALEQVKAANIQKLALTQDYHDTITALRAALAEEALQRLTDVSQEIEAALAEPEQEPVFDCPRCGHCCPQTEQEPVAWQWLNTANFRKKIPADATPAHWRPLYTAPPQRKPLTDEELEVLWDDATDRMEHFCSQYWDFARAIEKAHGIKGKE